jgi:hypothetical protein
VGDKIAARGVGFFDFFHNQNGAAGVARLLSHPLLVLLVGALISALIVPSFTRRIACK